MSPAEMLATATRTDRVLRFAERLFAKRINWVVFYREVLGIDGIVRRCFPTPEAMAEFEQSRAYEEIQRMLSQLRRQGDAMSHAEPVHAITVRLPASLHAALKKEARERDTNLNKLCISKLLQRIDEELVPKD